MNFETFYDYITIRKNASRLQIYGFIRVVRKYKNMINENKESAKSNEINKNKGKQKTRHTNKQAIKQVSKRTKERTKTNK